MPSALQMLGFWARPIPFFERCRARYGNRFTIRLLQNPPAVMLADPDVIREVYTAPPDVLHPGEGAGILSIIVGRYSVILLDEDAHLSQRKLMLPAFHGEKMKALTGVVEEEAEREIDGWPSGEPAEFHARLQDLTLGVILRAVFGVDRGGRFDDLRARLGKLIGTATSPGSFMPALRRGPAWRDYHRERDEADALLYELIDERRAATEERDDVLSMLLAARHEDDTPMSHQELRDELMTLLVAGHETTASELAWAFERLARTPYALRRLTEEVDAGGDEEYLTATIQETLRRRPVLPTSAPRLVMEEVEIGGWRYPPGCTLVPNAHLVHHDPAIYPDPYSFRPERFLDAQPGTYTWIPFGGGRRRCLGASFAQLEMKIVLRALLRRYSVETAGPEAEGTVRRAITISPRAGARVVLRERSGTRQAVAA